jgi:hypothetical protein
MILLSGFRVCPGTKYPALFGHYFFADYGTGRIWTIYKLEENSWSMPELELNTNHNTSTFGEDESGDLYFAHRSSSDGVIYRIIDGCEGDMNDDGDVDGFDLSEFAANYAPAVCNGDCPNDLNGDGVVHRPGHRNDGK